MIWLQGRLAFDSADAEQALRILERCSRRRSEVEPQLKDEIASTALLLKARAEFPWPRSVALETLKRLREIHPKTDAAIFSYLIESEYYTRHEKIDKARTTLISVIDTGVSE